MSDSVRNGLGFAILLVAVLFGVLGSDRQITEDHSHHNLASVAAAFSSSITENVTKNSGAWTDAATWTLGVPKSDQRVRIDHTVTLDTSSTISGVHIAPGGTLTFESGKSVTLQSAENMVVEGTLVMRPQTAATVHTLKFAKTNGTGLGN